jgi:hypothetical protein
LVSAWSAGIRETVSTYQRVVLPSAPC